tara:strand:+ start:323 stop:706 length:384 start_codon:yes stop_codon:yes gene_type:complete
MKKGNQGDGGGRPATELTEEQIQEVQTLSAVLNQSQTADYLGIPYRTFQAILSRDEKVSASYKKGKAKAINNVANDLLQQTREGNTAAMMFYLKTQAGWRETDVDTQRETPKVYIIQPKEVEKLESI